MALKRGKIIGIAVDISSGKIWQPSYFQVDEVMIIFSSMLIYLFLLNSDNRHPWISVAIELGQAGFQASRFFVLFYFCL